MIGSPPPPARPGPLRRVVYAIEYAALRLAETLALSFPPDAADAGVRAAARAFYRLDPRRRRTALENLRVAYGDALDDADREHLARRSFENAFLAGLDLTRSRRLCRSMRSMRRRVVLSGDGEALLADARSGRGGLVLSAHLGGWDSGERLRRERIPWAVVVRPIENPFVDAYAARLRGGRGAVIEKRGAVRDTMRAVRDGTWVAILADQNAGGHGEFVPFFGLAASTYRFGAAVAVREAVPVYMAAVPRRGRGCRYELRLRRYEVARDGDRRDEERRLLEAYSRQVEEWVRESPEQYMWMHRRWKTRPPGEAPGPHLPKYHRRRPLAATPAPAAPAAPA